MENYRYGPVPNPVAWARFFVERINPPEYLAMVGTEADAQLFIRALEVRAADAAYDAAHGLSPEEETR